MENDRSFGKTLRNVEMHKVQLSTLSLEPDTSPTHAPRTAHPFRGDADALLQLQGGRGTRAVTRGGAGWNHGAMSKIL